VTIKPGDAFWLWNAVVQKHHIHVVLTHPEPLLSHGSGNWVVVVNVTSIRTGIRYDATTVLQPGEIGGVIKQPSYVFYEAACFKATQELLDELGTKLSDGGTLASYIGLVSETLFERLQDGVQDSMETPPSVQEYCFKRHPGDGSVLNLGGAD